MNLAQLAEKAIERLGESKSLVFDGKEYSNVQLFDYSCRLQTAFSGLGMKKDSNIVLFLFVTDRVKDMIIRGGENIYPVQLENILYRFPGVAEAAIVGTPDPVYGEKIIGFVVASPGATLSEQEIINFMKTETSSFKVPSKIHLVEALPKTAIGKILKRELREKALSMS